jgi:hypothetical protein
MTCTNWTVTILSLIVIILAVWPNMLAATAVQWILIIAGLLIIVISWKGCGCSCCSVAPKKAAPRRRK